MKFLLPICTLRMIRWSPEEITRYEAKHNFCPLNFMKRGGANKTLARPTFRCRRMELIMSLERGVSSYADWQVFSSYRE